MKIHRKERSCETVDVRARVVAMDSASVEFGAVRRIDVSASVYAVRFDISVPFLLPFGSRVKNDRVAVPVDEPGPPAKAGLASRILPAISPQNSLFIPDAPPPPISRPARFGLQFYA
jgi:hypothetical protein